MLIFCQIPMFLHCVGFEHFRTFSFGFVEKYNTRQRFHPVFPKNTTRGKNVTVSTKTIGKPSVSLSKIFRTFSKIPDMFRKSSTDFGNLRTFVKISRKSRLFLF